MSRFMFLAAFAVIMFFCPPAHADGTDDSDVIPSPCASGDCAKKKPAPAPAPAPAPQPVIITPIEQPAPPPVERVIERVVERIEVQPFDEQHLLGFVHIGVIAGVSGGSWPVPAFVIDERYHDGVLGGEVLGGAYVLFGGHQKGVPYGGVSGSVGMGVIDSLTWRGDLDVGYMFGKRVGFGGVAGILNRELDYHSGTFANRYAAFEAGPELRIRLDKPEARDFLEGWLVTSLTAGLGGAMDVPDTFGHATLNVAFEGGFQFPNGKK